MRELEGRSYKEIAEILGLSTGALETLLFRARRSIAEELESLVTCDKAETSLSQQLDGRLGRKQRRRLDDHLADCPSCTRACRAAEEAPARVQGPGPVAVATLPHPFQGNALGRRRDVPAGHRYGHGSHGIGHRRRSGRSNRRRDSHERGPDQGRSHGRRRRRRRGRRLPEHQTREGPTARTPSRTTTVPNAERHQTPRNSPAPPPPAPSPAGRRPQGAAARPATKRHATTQLHPPPAPRRRPAAEQSNTSSLQGNAIGAQRRNRRPEVSAERLHRDSRRRPRCPPPAIPGAKHNDAKKPKKPKRPRKRKAPQTGRRCGRKPPAVATRRPSSHRAPPFQPGSRLAACRGSGSTKRQPDPWARQVAVRAGDPVTLSIVIAAATGPDRPHPPGTPDWTKTEQLGRPAVRLRPLRRPDEGATGRPVHHDTAACANCAGSGARVVSSSGAVIVVAGELVPHASSLSGALASKNIRASFLARCEVDRLVMADALLDRTSGGDVVGASGGTELVDDPPCLAVRDLDCRDLDHSFPRGSRPHPADACAKRGVLTAGDGSAGLSAVGSRSATARPNCAWPSVQFGRVQFGRTRC